MAGGPPAGWYPDPNDPSLARYWDGKAWTEFTGPRDERPPMALPPKGTPGTTPPPTGDARPQSIDPPRRLGTIAWWAYAVLGFAVVANLVDIPLSLAYADKVQTQIDAHSLTYQQAVDAEDTFAIGSVLYLVSAIAGAVGFLVWWYRAYSNLPGLTGQALRFGRGWSIGGWFVPILSLWRPKQIANDIWRGADPAARGNSAWTSLDVSPLVHWWWALFLLNGFLGGLAGGLLSSDPVLSNSVTGPLLQPPAHISSQADLRQEHAAAIAFAISAVAEVIAAVVAIVFVRRVSDRQDLVLADPGVEEAAT